MRYTAPAHVSGINLSIGPVVVVDGFVEVPDDLGAGDLGGLAMNGFTPVPADEPAPVPAKTPKVDPASTAASGPKEGQ